MPDTQELRDGLVSFVNRSVNAYARRHHGGRSGGDSGCSSTSGDGREQHVPDGNNTDAERPIKQRCESVTDVHHGLILSNRRISPTQPGRGIRKIVDLYHDLTDLLDKAKKHSSIINELDPTMIEEMNKIDFVGMSKEEIEEEQKEYATSLASLTSRRDSGVTDMIQPQTMSHSLEAAQHAYTRLRTEGDCS